jgi:hypothetical protein
MPVPLDPPYVRPATPEQTFPSTFFADFAVVVRSMTDGDGYIRSMPMADDGELALSQAKETRFDLWAACAAVPEAAAAMQAVMTALPLIEAWQAEQNP